MINKNELAVNELTDEENTIVQERIVVGEYELILTKSEKLKFLSFKKGKKLRNLLGSDMGIALFEEVKALRYENHKLKLENEELIKEKTINLVNEYILENQEIG